MRVVLATVLVLASGVRSGRAEEAGSREPRSKAAVVTITERADPAAVSGAGLKEKAAAGEAARASGEAGGGARGDEAASRQRSPEDEALLAEIEAAGRSGEGASVAAAGAAEQAPGDSSGKPGLSSAASARTSGVFPNIYNPAMSVNGLFVAAVTSARSPEEGAVRSALAVQELELQVLANVDPYFTANLTFAVPEGEGFGLEEGYLTPSSRPFGFEARLGMLRLPFGRENPLHTHALPFVDRSLIGRAAFGGEGLREVGAELSYLVPAPWYLLLSAGGFNGDNDVLFASPDAYNAMGMAALKNVFELTGDATLELGLSYARGRGVERQLSQAMGGHVALKWRPARRAREREAVVVVEAIYATAPNADAVPEPVRGPGQSLGGAYAYAQWRLAQQWHVAARFDYLGYPNEGRGVARRGSALLAFAPTEFSALRLQASVGTPAPHRVVVYEGLVQLNFTLGAHPAHGY